MQPQVAARPHLREVECKLSIALAHCLSTTMAFAKAVATPRNTCQHRFSMLGVMLAHGPSLEVASVSVSDLVIV
jgi:hypothetical protein